MKHYLPLLLVAVWLAPLALWSVRLFLSSFKRDRW